MVWLVLVWAVHAVDPYAKTCTFKATTGVPCPTCGLTRGVTAITDHGRVLQGLAFNPLFMTVLLGGLLLLALRLVAGRRVRLHLSPLERRAFWWVFGALVLANWAYLIVCVG